MQINIIKPEKILARTQIDLADFAINPYRGCEFGCRYCYAQENKNIKKRKQQWGSFVDIKDGASLVLLQELSSRTPRRVIMGTTTECFQPQEKKFKITKAILEILKKNNVPVVILTKSTLIEEYIHLLNYNPANKIYFTVMFSDNTIKALLEQKTPDIQQRIKTIQKLIERRIPVKIHIGPFMPGLENLKHLFSLIPKSIQEVEIEIYNSKMGRFAEILTIVKEHISLDAAQIIQDAYSSNDNYNTFCSHVIKETHALNELYNFKVNFIIPDYNNWYNDKIKY
ncbi:MAG: radical SAM protein [Planctomycetota bacterium]